MSVVVGYVPTPEGHAALNAAVAEAKLRDARLVVVNVSKGDALVDRKYAAAPDWTAVQDELTAAGVDFEAHQAVDPKDPSEQIVELSRSISAELIVIGLRRRTPVGKLIMGSQAQRILLDAEVPVLAVKAPH